MHAGPIEGALYLGFVDTLGFGTAIDSLAAIKRLVFDEKRLSLAELLEATEADFEGREAIRQLCLNAPKYGNDEPYADAIGHDIESFFVDLTRRYRTAFGGELDVRYVTITAHIPFGAVLGATPDGRRAGEPVSEGVSPSQGADRKGPTASLISIARTRCEAHKERAARLLNMKLSPSSVDGPEGTRKLMGVVYVEPLGSLVASPAFGMNGVAAGLARPCWVSREKKLAVRRGGWLGEPHRERRDT